MCIQVLGRKIHLFFCALVQGIAEEHDEQRQRSQLNFQQSRNVGTGNLDFSRLVQNSLSSYLRDLVTFIIGLLLGQSEIMLKTLF